MLVARYNARDCSIMVDGVYITGLGEEMVNFEKDEALFEAVVGACGDVIKNETNNDLHTLTLTVQPTSPQFGYLLDLKKRAESFPVWVINKQLGVRFGGTMANVIESPGLSLGATAEDVEITFCVFDGVLESTK